MGRGVDYRNSYPHFMLVKDELIREEEDMDDFMSNVLGKFRHAYKADHYVNNHARVFGETDYLEIGIDFTGDMACLFVRPKKYEDDGNEVPYQIDNTVRNAFNLLINDYGQDTFMFPTGGYSADPLSKYER